MSGLVVACGAVLGGCVGLVTPRLAYRLSVPYGHPVRNWCVRCGRPFPAGAAGWFRAGASCARCPAAPTRPVAGTAPPMAGTTPPVAGPAGFAGYDGPRWPVTVAVAGVAFAALAAAFGAAPPLFGYLIAAAVAVPLAFIDVACLRLPDRLVGAMLLGAGSPLVGLALAAGEPQRLGRAALAAAVCFSAYLLLALLPRGPLGFGDVKLAGVLGFLLGWLGWPAVLLGLALPHLIAGPVAVVLLVTGRARRRTALPFGPALLAGAWLAALATA